MARLVFGMMQSLDGYVGAPEGQPGLGMPSEVLHRHFDQQLSKAAGSLYGRRMYEIMRGWDDDQPGQDDVGRAFAEAWRAKPKWVVSRTLKLVGPNATLVDGDLESFVRGLKAEHEGDIEVAGPELAASLSALGLIDEYQLYLMPVVLGGGKPFFQRATPPLRLVGTEEIAEALLLRYVPG